MNGWMRLWVLITAIWAVVVVGSVAILWSELLGDPDGSWIVNRLSDESKPYFEDRAEDGGPMFHVEISLADGRKYEIEFPILSGSDLANPGDWIQDLLELESDDVSEQELARFADTVVVENERAKSALAEYQQLVQKGSLERHQSKKTILLVSGISLLGPPLIALAFGYAIAWVRRGFRS